MKYHLYSDWRVIVDLKIKHEGLDCNFRFDFYVNSDENFPDIIETAKFIAKEKFGHSVYEITQILLSSSE